MLFEPDKVHKVEFSPDCRVNVDDDVLLTHLAINIRRGLPQAHPFPPNDQTIVLVAGGPSLNLPEVEKELIEAYWRGGKVVAVNGSYQWCLTRNIRPSAFVMLDGREFNARFLETPVPDCHYFLGSECHPKVFELCRGRKVTIWHPLNAGEKALELLDDYYFNPEEERANRDKPRQFFKAHHYPVTLGTTVALRAISLLRMVGFTRFDLYGLDSCYLDGHHHAYEQAENNSDVIVPVWLRPQGRDDLARRFLCSVWMAKQFGDFCELMKERGEMFRLKAHGPGLIATALSMGLDAGGSVELQNPADEAVG